MQESHRRRFHFARLLAFEKGVLKASLALRARIRTVGLVAAVASFGVACCDSVAHAAANHEADQFEVVGPETAPPSRHVLPNLQQRSASANLPALATKMISSAKSLGLEGRQLPPRRANSLGIPPQSLQENAETWSLSVARDYPALLGLSPEELELQVVRDTGKLIYVHYRQQLAGVPVLDTRLTFQWDRDGHLRSTGAQIYSEGFGSSAEPAFSGPWISEADAQVEAMYGFPADIEVAEWKLSERAWLPTTSSTDDFNLLPVWNLQFLTENPPGRYEVRVHAETGTLLSRENTLHFEELSGSVHADIEPITVGDPPVSLPLRDSYLGILGANDFLVTDENGNFGADVLAGDYDVVSALAGQRIYILNALSGYAVPSDTFQVTAPGSSDFRWDDSNSRASDRDAYYHGNVAYQEIRAIDSTAGLAALDQSMQTVIDDPTGACNAYWNGSRMNFYAEGNGCPSIGRIADVVYHEYGHAVTEFSYWPASAPGEIHEGFSDYFAATILDDPTIGKGFRGPGTILREIETDRVWPDDVAGDTHITGLIVAGALWDVRKELGRETTDRLWHFARYAGAQTFDDVLLDILIQDDDDADLSNGTPNFEVIVRNFRAHGIGNYNVEISADRLPDVESPKATIDGEVTIWSLLPLNADDLALFYAYDDATEYVRVDLVATGTPRQYSFAIPTPERGTAVRYYWSAANEDGASATLPQNAPASTYSFFVGEDLVPPFVAAEAPQRTLTEEATHFYFRADASDNSGQLSRTWVEYKVGDAGAVTEQDLTEREDGQLEVAIELPVLTNGASFFYRILAADDAKSQNLGAWPKEGYQEIPVSPGFLYDFESANEALSSNFDWEYGVPPEGRAFSGVHSWGTILDGNYSHETTSDLVFGPFDFTDYERAMLQFRHTYIFESFYDGGNVEITTHSDPADPGARWTLLVPIDGYSYGTVAALGAAGYSGTLEGWESATFPLDGYLGETVYIRLVMAADQGVSDPGWFVDDFHVYQAQAWVDPSNFRATDGEDSQVTLNWGVPLGIDAQSGRLLGYNLHRRVAQTEQDFVQINDVVLNQFHYVDTDVDNDTAYEYRLQAAYDRGESEGVEVVANPFAATLSLSADSFGGTLSNYDPVSNSISVQNAGSGTLTFDVFLADDGETLDDVIATYQVGEPDGQPVEVATDPVGDSPVDITSLSITPGEFQGQKYVQVQVKGASPWGDPLSDWGGALFIDTDGDLSTGTAGLELGWNERTNIGGEYIVIFGSLPAQAGLDGEVFLVDVQSGSQPRLLPAFDFPEDGDELSFVIPNDWLRSPDEMQLHLVVAPGLGAPAFDHVPDLPEAVSWLTRSPKHGHLTAGLEQEIAFEMGNDDLANGTYRAELLVRSNDNTNPVTSVLAAVQVDRAPSPTLATVQFVPSLAGMECSFSLRPTHKAKTVHVERAQSHENPVFVQISAGPLQPDADGVYTLVDRGVSLGEEYLYRFPVEFEGSYAWTYETTAQVYSPSIPDLASVLLESEVAGVRLEFSVPESVPAVGARIDRSLNVDPAKWDEVTTESLTPDSSGVVSYLDLSVVENTEYLYRFQVEVENGNVLSYGPHLQTFADAFPQEVPWEWTSGDEALEVSVTLSDVFNPLVGVWVDRREADTAEWTRISDVAYLPDAKGVVTASDPWKNPWRDGVEAGRDYEYQFSVVVQGGRTRVYGPFAGSFVPTAPLQTTIHAARPNPFRSEVVFRLDLAESANVRLDLYDAAGRRRRVLLAEEMDAGAHQLVWNGQDDASQDLPTGIYFARFHTGSVTKTMRVLRVR